MTSSMYLLLFWLVVSPLGFAWSAYRAPRRNRRTPNKRRRL
jgi:hypothetical protein